MLNVKSATPRPANRAGHFRKLAGVASLLAVAVLTGCSTLAPMALTREADRETACVAVQWTPRDQILNYCERDSAYGRANQACLVDGYRIVSAKPGDWYDEAALASLGRELYHALGARHELVAK